MGVSGAGPSVCLALSAHCLPRSGGSCPNAALTSNLHILYHLQFYLSIWWSHSQKLGFGAIQVSEFKAANTSDYLPRGTTVQT